MIVMIRRTLGSFLGRAGAAGGGFREAMDVLQSSCGLYADANYRAFTKKFMIPLIKKILIKSRSDLI
jgi:hypothetical protein